MLSIKSLIVSVSLKKEVVLMKKIMLSLITLVSIGLIAAKTKTTTETVYVTINDPYYMGQYKVQGCNDACKKVGAKWYGHANPKDNYNKTQCICTK